MKQVTIERDGVNAPAGMDVLETIRTRRSIGAVRQERPPRAVIEEILEAATWAPNHRLTEPWRFIVLAGSAREAFGEVMAKSKVAPLIEARLPWEADYERAKAKALRAPVIIVVAVEPQLGPKVVEIEEITAGAAAIQNMLLAAHTFGLGTIWRTGDACYSPEVKAYLGLGETAHLLGFVYLGYPIATSIRAKRTPSAELTRWIGWDEVLC
ncbi:MAG: nitroreductase [Thermomicrobiales bacterium]